MAAGFGLKEFEVVEGAVPGALGGIDAALEEGEILAAANEIESDTVGVVTVVFGVALVVPDFGVGEGVAAEEPFGIDEGSYEEGLFGSGWLPAVEVLAGEGAEGGGSSPAVICDRA